MGTSRRTWLWRLGLISPRAPGSCVADWLYACDIHDRKFICSLMTVPRSRMQPRAKTDCGSGRVKDMASIDERLAGASDRTQFGHWKGDLIIGKGGRTAVTTLASRVTRITIYVKVSTRRSTDVVDAIARRMRARQVLTITWDQGKEMAEPHQLAKRLGISIYFADGHSPWQRGSGENASGVSRRHIPREPNRTTHPRPSPTHLPTHERPTHGSALMEILEKCLGRTHGEYALGTLKRPFRR